jgi:hypothetical protein
MTQICPLDSPASSLSPVLGASFGPMDATLCLAYGKDVFRFYRLLENAGTTELRPLPPPRLPSNVSRSMTAHCWLKNPQDHALLVRTSHTERENI